jgi:hypothetical protein
MSRPVYALLGDSDRGEYVLGVFADRARAAHLARAHARARAANLRREDKETFDAPVASDLYEIVAEDHGSDLDVSVRHRFSPHADPKPLVRSRVHPRRGSGACRPPGIPTRPITGGAKW